MADKSEENVQALYLLLGQLLAAVFLLQGALYVPMGDKWKPQLHNKTSKQNALKAACWMLCSHLQFGKQN